jgi:hypothetical protein
MTPDERERLLAEIVRFCALLAGPKGRLELRAPRVPQLQTCFGLFTDWDALATQALFLEGRGAPGIYVCPNLFRLELFRDAPENHLIKGTTWAVEDADILTHRWLYIDLDPIRRHGIKSDATTEREHEAAIHTAISVHDWLIQRGAPPRSMLLVDTGNGAAVLLKLPFIAARTDDADQLQDVLRAISFRFNTDAVHIDTTTYNASRLVRLAGTLNQKGSGTPERPHRRAHLIPMRIPGVP